MSNARKLADNLPTEGQLSGRNIIINGGMTIAQRQVQSTNAGSGYITVDRFHHGLKYNTDNFTYTTEQVTDAPSGFSKSLKLTCTTAETALAADEYGRIRQIVEGNNLERIGFGTSDAKQLTLSFYVKSSITGNWSASLYVYDTNKHYSKPYTINSANTWEYKTITFPALTSGAPAYDNSGGLILNFGLFAGSDSNTASTDWATYAQANFLGGQTANLAGTLNATWQITGIQLEVGPQASPFEHRSYVDEFLRCARYYFKNLAPVYTSKYGSNAINNVEFPVPMRSSPSLSVVTGTAPTAFGGESYVPYASMYVYHASTDGAAVSNYQADAEL